MDIEILSELVRSLLLEHDEVVLPGLGTFVAEQLPASFSDRGFTINPPYRRLSLRQRESEDTALSDAYALRTGRSAGVAAMELSGFIFDLKETLKERKTVALPGLGRLRATRENHFFFVPYESPDIYPDGFALESISLKFHEDEPVETPAPPAPVAEVTAEGGLPQTAATLGTLRGGTVSGANGGAEQSEAVSDRLPSADAAVPETVATPAAGTAIETASVVRPRRTLWRVILALLLAAALFFALLALLGRLAPDLIDPLLYNSDELSIIRHP